MLYRTLSLKIVFILLLSLLMCYCGNTHETHYQLASDFLNKIKNEDYKEAKEMLANPNRSWEDIEGEFKQLHAFLIQYKIPAFNKWHVEYDTLTIVEREIYHIPLYDPNNSKPNTEPSVRIDFEYHGEHVGNLIMFFNVQ